MAAQTLSREVPTSGGGKKTVYNLRRLNEVPFHLINSQQFMELKRDCLLNFEFCLAKVTASGLKAVYEDLQMALAVEPGDGDIRLLTDTLQVLYYYSYSTYTTGVYILLNLKYAIHQLVRLFPPKRQVNLNFFVRHFIIIAFEFLDDMIIYLYLLYCVLAVI